LIEIATERRHQVAIIARHGAISLTEMIHRQDPRQADLSGSKPQANLVQDPARLGWGPLVIIEHNHLSGDAIRQASGAC
jgi:hypothetical protein